MDEKKTGRLQFVKGFLWGLAVMLAVGAAAAVVMRVTGSGFLTKERKGGTRSQVLSGDAREKLGELADIVDAYYYDKVDSDALLQGVYAGLLEGLDDPYSQYYTAEEYKSLDESTSGTYYGIGAVLSQNRETKEVSVLHVYPGSPAAEAGVKDGDILIQVGDIESTSMDLSKLVQSIKGEEGSAVHLTVSRKGEEKELEYDVERRKIEVPTVESSMLDNSVGLIKITEFSEVTTEQFKAALTELKDQGMVSMIVDLRDNPGGLLTSVCEILDEILPEGTLVYTEDKYGNRKNYESSGDTYLEIPLAVLINENSASASEIFAGAIKDFKYGTLIGTTSFGKGIVQQIIPLEDGSAVKITIAKYFTPSGNYIHDVGIDPDVELEYEYLNKDDQEYDPMHDNQVLKALEILKNK